MGKQKVRFNQGFIISLAGFASWYVISAGIYILLGLLMEGPAAVFVFVAVALLTPVIPVGILGGVLLLFDLRHRFAFSPWLAWGVVAGYLINIIASDLTSSNGVLGFFTGIPFFMMI